MRHNTDIIENVDLATDPSLIRAPICWRAAEGEPQRVATALLHLVPAARRLLCAQHVRRRRRRELSQVSRKSGAGGEGQARRTTRPQT